MKLNINNKTNIPFNIIGEVFDNFMMINPYLGDMIEYELFEYKKKDYKMTIEYKLTCVSITVEELEIEAKEITIKNIKFPKIPKKY